MKKRIIVMTFLLLTTLTGVAFASPPNPQDFIDRMAPAAQRTVTPSCGFPSVTIAQGGQESGWGTSELYRYNNPFGRKCGVGPCVWILTPEYRDGVRVMEWHQFQVYISLDAALVDYCDKLSKPWYKRDFRSAQAFIKSIAKPYATDPNYAARVWKIIKRYDLERFDRRDGDAK